MKAYITIFTTIGLAQSVATGDIVTGLACLAGLGYMAKLIMEDM